MNTRHYGALFAVALTLAFTLLAVVPDDADAKRFGGGSSVGSRGSRSFSTPRQPTARTATNNPSTSTAPQRGMAPQDNRSSGGFGSGLMGGIGGLLVGGMIGSMLFGGNSGTAGVGTTEAGAAAAGGGGIGILEILLIGAALFFLYRWFKRKKAQQSTSSLAAFGGSSPMPMENQGPMQFSSFGDQDDPSFAHQGHGQFNQPQDEISQGLETIRQMDPHFNEAQFLEGAKLCFQQIQGAWSDWSVDRLRPLLTDRMWQMVEAQAAGRKKEGIRDIIEKIQFNHIEISEAWQESGENWITVRFQVDMVEYSTDVAGKLLEGDPNQSNPVEEFWTFNRPVGAQDPNWFLSAIQQPGEVAKSVS